jgi:hypothetical protein
MNLRSIVLGAMVAVIPAATITGHHSLAGVYETDRQISMEGVITKVQFVNPHPFITITVKESEKKTAEWVLELDNLSELIEIGMTSTTLMPKDQVTVSGNPGRDKQQKIYLLRLDRPVDGFRYEQIGYTPRIETRPR